MISSVKLWLSYYLDTNDSKTQWRSHGWWQTQALDAYIHPSFFFKIANMKRKWGEWCKDSEVFNVQKLDFCINGNRVFPNFKRCTPANASVHIVCQELTLSDHVPNVQSFSPAWNRCYFHASHNHLRSPCVMWNHIHVMPFRHLFSTSHFIQACSVLLLCDCIHFVYISVLPCKIVNASATPIDAVISIC